MFKSSVSKKQTQPKGQNKPHVHSVRGQGGIPQRCGKGCLKSKNEVRAKDCFGTVWTDVRRKGQLKPLWKAPVKISVKTLKLSKIRSHPISADSMLKFCLSSVISYKHESSSGAPESLLFILPYPGCVQSIHKRPVFLINHKRFLFCLQLVLG